MRLLLIVIHVHLPQGRNCLQVNTQARIEIRQLDKISIHPCAFGIVKPCQLAKILVPAANRHEYMFGPNL